MNHLNKILILFIFFILKNLFSITNFGFYFQGESIFLDNFTNIYYVGSIREELDEFSINDSVPSYKEYAGFVISTNKGETWQIIKTKHG